jgi:lipopolysaccharide transport system ATP-binding protein
MPAPMISVENLSKRYLVGHRGKREGQASYTALREVIGQELRNFGRKAGDLMRGRQVVQGDTIEEFWALKDVNFEVREGEVLGIIGRNGAGKSTLLKVLSRITEPTAGRVTLRGRVASLLEVGTGFHPELTGRENIFLNGAILGMGRAEIRKKFDQIVAFAEIERFLDTPVKRYSSGMYVRLAFAVAAHLEPEILIVDEVLAVGDAEFQKKCLGKMGEVSRAGRTVLFVSHNMAAMRTLCTKALLLESGVVTANGPVYDAVELYLRQNRQRSQGWVRPLSLDTPDVTFERLGVSFAEQSTFKLTCTMEIRVRAPRAASMVAVDVQNAFGSSIMQALPSLSPFVPGQPGEYKVTVEISLPPLIPGTFWLTFWIGPYNNETYDEIAGALSFDVFDSPTPGRTFPHTVDHGYIVPSSACKLESQSDTGALETARS